MKQRPVAPNQVIGVLGQHGTQRHARRSAAMRRAVFIPAIAVTCVRKVLLRDTHQRFVASRDSG